MFYNAYLEEAKKVCQLFDNQQPLSLYLKRYFKQKNKFGSRDRRYISHLVYAYFRSYFLGKNDYLTAEERIAWGSYLANSMPREFYEKCFSELSKQLDLDFTNRMNMFNQAFDMSPNMPYELSSSISVEEYVHSIFEPKFVFIRARKNLQKVIDKLRNANIDVVKFEKNVLRVPLNTKLEHYLSEDSYVVQDLASQSAGLWFKPQSGETWFDCCAASGGKSIQLLDTEANIKLTVSDIRETILHNLTIRMNTYHPRLSYTKKVLDMSASDFQTDSKYDKVICDAPCSGSGTWGRSPEQFYFFSEEKLMNYQALQTNILANALTCLRPNGTLFYITCSVFKAENEDVIAPYFQDYEIKHALINKFSDGGDCLFIAQLKRKKSE